MLKEKVCVWFVVVPCKVESAKQAINRSNLIWISRRGRISKIMSRKSEEPSTSNAYYQKMFGDPFKHAIGYK